MGMNNQPITSLTELRERHGLSQSELAEILGVAQPYIAAVESGRKGISATRLEDAIERVGQFESERERWREQMRKLFAPMTPEEKRQWQAAYRNAAQMKLG